jgi:hypothetical protein
MSTYKDENGVIKYREDDTVYRQDKLDYSEKDKSRHEHTWSKTDTNTGKHQEGWTGANYIRKREE